MRYFVVLGAGLCQIIYPQKSYQTTTTMAAKVQTQTPTTIPLTASADTASLLTAIRPQVMLIINHFDQCPCEGVCIDWCFVNTKLVYIHYLSVNLLFLSLPSTHARAHMNTCVCNGFQINIV